MTPELINSIAAFIGATAWPVIAVFFLIRFRKSVAKMLKNVSSLTLPGGFKAELLKARDEKEQAERRANEALDAEKDLEIENEALQERFSSDDESDQEVKTNNEGADTLAKMAERVTKYHPQLKSLFQNRKGAQLILQREVKRFFKLGKTEIQSGHSGEAVASPIFPKPRTSRCSINYGRNQGYREIVFWSQIGSVVGSTFRPL